MNTTTADQTALTADKAMAGRMLKDAIFQRVMSVGGISVIIAVSAIFFYLASVVVPLFMPPGVTAEASFTAPGAASQRTVALTSEEQREIGVRVGAQGAIDFFAFDKGAALAQDQVPLPAGTSVTSFDQGERSTYTVGYGLSDGRVILAKLGFAATFPGGKRLITPSITYPLGSEPLAADPRGQAIQQLSVQQSDTGSTVVVLTQDGRLLVSAANVTTNLMTGVAIPFQQLGSRSMTANNWC